MTMHKLAGQVEIGAVVPEGSDVVRHTFFDGFDRQAKAEGEAIQDAFRSTGRRIDPEAKRPVKSRTTLGLLMEQARRAGATR